VNPEDLVPGKAIRVVEKGGGLFSRKTRLGPDRGWYVIASTWRRGVGRLWGEIRGEGGTETVLLFGRPVLGATPGMEWRAINIVEVLDSLPAAEETPAKPAKAKPAKGKR
jgi:hypothetical protein